MFGGIKPVLDVGFLLGVSLSIAIISFFGLVLVVRDYIQFLLTNELFLFAITLCLVCCGYIYNDIIPEIFAFIIISTSAAELVIGLSIIVRLYRLGEKKITF